MPKADEPPVAVEQVDCDAAADLIEAYFHDEVMLKLAQDFRGGHRFGPWPYAFARHRLNNRPAQPQPVDEVEGFVPCPTCRQYSHSIGDDKAAHKLIFESLYHLRLDDRARDYHDRAQKFLATNDPVQFNSTNAPLISRSPDRFAEGLEAAAKVAEQWAGTRQAAGYRDKVAQGIAIAAAIRNLTKDEGEG